MSGAGIVCASEIITRDLTDGYWDNRSNSRQRSDWPPQIALGLEQITQTGGVGHEVADGHNGPGRTGFNPPIVIGHGGQRDLHVGE